MAQAETISDMAVTSTVVRIFDITTPLVIEAATRDEPDQPLISH